MDEFGVILYLALVFALAIAPIVVASNITLDKRRGRGLGLLLGLSVGWFGVLIAHLLNTRVDPYVPVTYRKCPNCEQQMRQDTSVCPHCRSVSPAQAFANDV